MDFKVMGGSCGAASTKGTVPLLARANKRKGGLAMETRPWHPCVIVGGEPNPGMSPSPGLLSGCSSSQDRSRLPSKRGAGSLQAVGTQVAAGKPETDRMRSDSRGRVARRQASGANEHTGGQATLCHRDQLILAGMQTGTESRCEPTGVDEEARPRNAGASPREHNTGKGQAVPLPASAHLKGTRRLLDQKWRDIQGWSGLSADREHEPPSRTAQAGPLPFLSPTWSPAKRGIPPGIPSSHPWVPPAVSAPVLSSSDFRLRASRAFPGFLARRHTTTPPLPATSRRGTQGLSASQAHRGDRSQPQSFVLTRTEGQSQASKGYSELQKVKHFFPASVPTSRGLISQPCPIPEPLKATHKHTCSQCSLGA